MSPRRHQPHHSRGPQPTVNGSQAAWRKLRLAIISRDGPDCVLCGRPGNSVDHIIPRNQGGTNDPSNLRVLCVRCNSSRPKTIPPASATAQGGRGTCTSTTHANPFAPAEANETNDTPR